MAGSETYFEEFLSEDMTQTEWSGLREAQDAAETTEEKLAVTDEFLEKRFQKIQKSTTKTGTENYWQVSQRRGLKTVVSKWGNEAALEQISKGEDFYGVKGSNVLAAEEIPPPDEEAMKKFYAESKAPVTTTIRVKEAGELRDSLVQESEKSNTAKSLLDKTLREEMKLSLDAFKRRDIVDEDRDSLLRVTQRYNEAWKAEAKANLLKKLEERPDTLAYKERLLKSGIPETQVNNTVTEQLFAQNRKKLDDLDQTVRVQLRTQEKVRMTSDLLSPAEATRVHQIRSKIDEYRTKGDLRGLDNVMAATQRMALQKKDILNKSELRGLYGEALASRTAITQLRGGRAPVIPKQEFRVLLDEEIKGDELNKLTRQWNIAPKELTKIRREATAEVKTYVPRGVDKGIRDLEINRKIVEKIPGFLTVDEELKSRIGAKTEKEYLNKLATTPIAELTRDYGTTYREPLLTKENIVDNIVKKEFRGFKGNKQEIADARNYYLSLGEEALLAQAPELGRKVKDSIPRGAISAAKKIAQNRLKLLSTEKS